MSEVFGGAVPRSAAQVVRGAKTGRIEADVAARDQIVRNRALIARYFLDLRAALRLSPQLAAAHMRTFPEIVEALETGRIEDLPPWQEVVRIVMTYTTMAGIDGRPSLAMLSETLGLMAHVAAAPVPAAARPAMSQTGARLRNVAAGARRLPQDALRGARARPDRAFYALSLPLGLMILALNTSAMSRGLTSVSDFFHVHFAEVREGHRWIEVSDPRSRRADKLRVAIR